MAVTEQDGNRSSQDPFCSAALRQTNALWFLTASNILLAITSTLGNTLILIALSKESCLHPPSKILLRSLAVTDFFVGIFLGPRVVIALMPAEYGSFSRCYYIITICIFIGISLFFASLFTLTVISVDRLLALLLGIRYRQVVTFKRVLAIVICFWTLITSLAMVVVWDYRFSLHYNSTAVLLCSVTSTSCYTKIYHKLHHHQIHVHQGQPDEHTPLNIARYRKTVNSALWVQLTLVTCYLPAGTVVALMAIKGITSTLGITWIFFVTVVHLNSTLNPILYCWKIREVRRAVVEILRPTLCLSPN